MKLTVTKFGNPQLRKVARRLSVEEILDSKTQELITAMQDENQRRSFGVGVAAPQFGVDMAICIIGIKPTPARPGLEKVDMVLINPEITDTYGKRTGMWEGCWSFGDHKHDSPFAKAMRYKKIKLKYYDQHAKQHHVELDGFVANVVQHETDHLNGILFVDRVKDSKTFVMGSEYRKIRAAELEAKANQQVKKGKSK